MLRIRTVSRSEPGAQMHTMVTRYDAELYTPVSGTVEPEWNCGHGHSSRFAALTCAQMEIERRSLRAS